MFDNAIRIVPRMRACRFSSARPGFVPAKGSASFNYRLLILSKQAKPEEMEAEYRAFTGAR